MRLLQTPVPLLYLITTVLLLPQPILAGPSPPQPTLAGFSYDELFQRWDCPSPSHKCGYYDQLCCGSDTGCYTNSLSQAECTPKSTIWASSAAAHHTTGYHRTTGGPRRKPTSSHRPSEASPGIGATSHSRATITETTGRTVQYQTPIPTGAQNITLLSTGSGSSLSGGAIAGIVIGVLVGLAILCIICFYCCLKGLWDAFLALFGMGKRRKVTEVDEYTRRTHYSSDGRRRTWYGAPKKKEKIVKKESSGGKELLGVGAGLAGLWAILGLKRRREERRKEEERSRYNGSYFSSDYYTSESSASSDERRSERYSRHSVRRSGSRRP